MTTQNHTLFFGDNLKILGEKIPNETFDLIYLDPPFNSNRNYNVLFKEGKVDSTAQIHAFEDTWEWTESTVSLFDELKRCQNPKIIILTNSLWEFIGPTPMMAYLVNLMSRLLLLHQVLKKTGTLYLHCDPTTSHYLKIILDVIFGPTNFRNEIVWHYRRWSAASNNFQRMHDILLRYTKSDKYTFTKPMQPYSDEKWVENTVRGMVGGKLVRLKDDSGNYIKRNKENTGVLMHDVWEDINFIPPTGKERLGYPTQKPEALLERIIKASTNENDWVLDPFCGCGTSVAVAERLHRNWIGIDISMLAINVIKQRMDAHYPHLKINIDGIPMDFEGAEKLAQKDKFSFQDWAISLIGANPPSGETRKGADRGIDGLILFYDREDLRSPNLKKIIVQVKGGNTGRGDIAKLKGDMERENAPMGVLITLNDPTSEMKRETSLAGEYRYSENVSFPKIQILSIRDWFAGNANIKLPTDLVNPFKRAQTKVDQGSLFEK